VPQRGKNGDDLFVTAVLGRADQESASQADTIADELFTFTV
jgi:hypothetical protein